MKKTKLHAFGKDVYLLGLKNGDYLWLEAASWDCGWYWGFGYMESYTYNKRPNYAKDIKSHQHIDGIKTVNIFNYFDETTFSEKEGWELSELFKQFYLLREMAAFTHREKPSTGVSSAPVDHGSLKDWNEKINTELLPRIFQKIYEILGAKK